MLYTTHVGHQNIHLDYENIPLLMGQDNAIIYHRCTALFVSEAFDTINYNIMLRKLEYYGIRSKALEWLKSYLANIRHILT